jgi:arylsulfatase A-like enzyme
MQMISKGLFGDSPLRPTLIVLLLVGPLACGFTTEDWPGTISNDPPQLHADEPSPPQMQSVREALDSPPSDPTPVTDPSSPPNVIMIIVDALRADHVSAYGYSRPTTPNLDAFIADQGVIFQDSISASSWTYPSNAAMLIGRNPSSIGVVWADRDSSIPADETMLAEYLHDAGYYTAGFTSAWYASAQFGFNQGFDVFEEHIGHGADRTRAEELNVAAMAWLSNTWTSTLSGTQPLFLYLYYFDPHTWYNPPSPYDTLYDATYTGTLTAEVYQDGVAVASGVISPTARDVLHLVALYDGEINYWDHHLGEMLTTLDDLRLLDSGIVIVTSDHGEMFGEHDKWVHGNSLYEEVLRVPLLIRYTGAISAGQVVSMPVQAVDILPSVLDWADMPVPEDLRGISLRPLVQAEPKTGTGTLTPARAVFSEMDVDAISDPDYFAPDRPLRAIRRGDWKYIHHVSSSDRDVLYQLQPTSLYETANVLEAQPEIADDLFQELVAWFGLPTARIFMPYVQTGGQSAPAVVRSDLLQ